MLRVRQSTKPNSTVVATVPVNQQHRPPPNQRFKFQINATQSTQDYWKLAVGCKAKFTTQLAGGLDNEYNEMTEGWIIKNYQGQNTLELDLFNSESSTEGQKSESSSTTSSAPTADLQTNAKGAARILSNVLQSGGRLLVLTGAGMSVSSGVPVFRAADGTMSEDFLTFLRNYNKARKAHHLPEADDWFSFSVPEMFRPETEKEAWAYWKWRITRSVVTPAEDYTILNTIMERFGQDRTFVRTSNCDMLHELSGVDCR